MSALDEVRTLAGRTAVVTAAGHGMGRALTRADAYVVDLGRREFAPLQALRRDPLGRSAPG